MNNTRLTELTNKFIDNDLTAEEEQELNLMLKEIKNKEYFESMKEAIKLLESSKPVPLEINVRNSVINTINKQNEATAMKKIKSWFNITFAGPKISYAISFALGALAVGLLFSLLPGEDTVDDIFMTGVMSDRAFDRTYFLNDNSLEGEVKVKQSEGVVILDVDLKTSEQMDCELSYDKNQFALYGVKSVESVDGGKFASHGSSIRLSNLQSNHYLVFLRFLRNDESKVNASFYNGSITVAMLTIDIKN